MLKLPGVMVCAASSVSLKKTWEALERSCQHIRFGDAVFFTDQCDTDKFISADIRCETIRPLRSREAYSRFILKDLSSRATCEHVLIVQWDGFVSTAAAWRDEFLSYDYIGATWPHFSPPFNVGNGGFSLRSKRLLDALATDRFTSRDPEDIAICHDWRLELEADFGIRFAPPHVAELFAFERGHPTAPTFGFHGLFNIPDIIPLDEQDRWFAGLAVSNLVSRDAQDLIIRLAREGRRMTAISLLFRTRRDRRKRFPIGFWLRLIKGLFGLHAIRKAKNYI